MSNWPIRKIEQDDMNLVYSSWAHVRRRMTDLKYSSKEVFKSSHARLVEIIPRFTISAVYDKEHASVAYGWIATEGNILHMVWVRDMMRNVGIGSRLFQHALGRYSNIVYTAHTSSLHRFNLIKKWRLTEYNPFLIYDRTKGVMIYESSKDNVLRARPRSSSPDPIHIHHG